MEQALWRNKRAILVPLGVALSSGVIMLDIMVNGHMA